jgi:hypothetical protein
MTRAWLGLLAGLLLLGQGVALHHDHASAADCAPTACTAQDASTEPAGHLHVDGECPFCDMHGRNRHALPTASAGPREPIVEPRPTTAPPRHERLASGPGRTGRAPRAPPRSV